MGNTVDIAVVDYPSFIFPYAITECHHTRQNQVTFPMQDRELYIFHVRSGTVCTGFQHF